MNIILGGTSSLGEKIADKLRASGDDPYIVGSSYDAFYHGKGMAVDLKDLSDVEQLARHIRGMGEKALDGFYWVAGYGYNGDFADQEDALEMSLVNYAHVIPIAQAAWRKMIEQDHGNFVVVSSTTGTRVRSDETVYGGSKYAQVGFARDLGAEAKRLETGVKVSLFMPGGMRTPFWDKNPPKNYDEFLDPEKVAREIIQDVAVQPGYPYERTIERGSL